MSLQQLIALSGSPEVGVSVTSVCNLYESVRDIKLYKEQFQHLSNLCIGLVLTLHNAKLEGAIRTEAVKKVGLITQNAESKARGWAKLDRIRSCLYQREMRDSLHEIYQDIEGCTTKFQIIPDRGLQNLAAIQARDRMDNRETLQILLRNVEGIRARLNEAEIAQLMQVILEELHSAFDSEQQHRDLQQGLWKLQYETSVLLPTEDLSGLVYITNEHPMAVGAFNSVYTGMWLCEEKVALKLPHGINQSAASRKLYFEEVQFWRTFRHPNVLRLLGVAYIRDRIFSVSPWMEIDAITYVRKHPEADAFKIVREVLSGLEYIHALGVVHGDLRGSNILIADNGSACISDFGLSRVVEKFVPSIISTNSNTSSLRWQAPEILDPGLYNLLKAHPTTASDVWGYGMLCLELFTLRPPYPQRGDLQVARDITLGKIPDRPPDVYITWRGLTDQMWALMVRCWNAQPPSRPTAAQLNEEVSAISQSTTVSTDDLVQTISSFPSPPLLESPPLLPVRDRSFDGNRLSPPPSFQSFGSRPRTAPSSIRRMNSSFNVGASREPLSATASSFSRSMSPGPMMIPMSNRRPSTASDVGPKMPRASNRRPSVSSDMSSPPKTPGLQVYMPSVQSITSTLRKQSLSSLVSEDSKSGTSWHTPSYNSRKPSFGSYNMPMPTPNRSLIDAQATALAVPGSESETASSFDANSGRSIDSTNIAPSIIRYSNDGSIKEGTLTGLVERLTTRCADPKDDAFRTTFLTTFRTFTTPEQLFHALVHRFQSASVIGKSSMETRINVPYLVLYVIQDWLTRYDKGTIPLPLLMEFLSFVQSIKTPVIVAELAKRLSVVIEEAVFKFRNRSSSVSTKSSRMSTSVDVIQPKELALALTVTEAEMFNAIQRVDVISHLIDPNSSNSVLKAIAYNNKITTWVKRTILDQRQIEKRIGALKNFIVAAEECRKIYNFSSMFAIVIAIESSLVSRLRLTMERLDKANLSRLKQLLALLKPDKNHSNYRKALSSKKGNFYLPFLAVNLMDLTATFQMQNAHEAHPVYNFKTCTKLSEGVDRFLEYQQHDHEIDPTRYATLITFLEERLLTLDPEKEERRLEALSLDYQKDEEKLRRSRTLEMRSAGFRA